MLPDLACPLIFKFSLELELCEDCLPAYDIYHRYQNFCHTLMWLSLHRGMEEFGKHVLLSSSSSMGCQNDKLLSVSLVSVII